MRLMQANNVTLNRKKEWIVVSLYWEAKSDSADRILRWIGARTGITRTRNPSNYMSWRSLIIKKTTVYLNFSFIVLALAFGCSGYDNIALTWCHIKNSSCDTINTCSQISGQGDHHPAHSLARKATALFGGKTKSNAYNPSLHLECE